MPRYSTAQLIDRANAGNIGRRGLRRLLQAGIDPSELGASGVDSPLRVDPTDDLAARRAALYSRALQAAHDLPQGQALSQGLKRRLELGPGGAMSRSTFAPHSAQEVQNLSAQYPTILEALRKRTKGIASTAGIYRF